MITVEGVSITSEQIENTAVKAKILGRFFYSDIMRALEKNGVPYPVSYRGADRWLQLMKKKGRIRFVYKKTGWEWIE